MPMEMRALGQYFLENMICHLAQATARATTPATERGTGRSRPMQDPRAWARRDALEDAAAEKNSSLST